MNKMSYREEEVVEKRGFIDVSIKSINETISLSELRRNKNIKLSEKKIKEKSKILDILHLNNQKYFLYASKKGKVFITSDINYFCKIKQNIKCRITKKYVYFYGNFTNICHKVNNFNKI